MAEQYGYIEDFISKQRSNGKYTFSLAEVSAKFGKSEKAIVQALLRLRTKKEIISIRKGFYVIVTPEYSSRGIPPPSLFIDDLMKFLQRDYYVGLLNAAMFYGAAHQQPQEFSVITGKPTLRNISKSNLHLNFYVKKTWAKEDIVEQKVETGFINISAPELTALDIVFYFDQVGGFNRIATVLDELCENMDGRKLEGAAQRFQQITTVQRLGFILEEILGRRELSDPLAEWLQTVNYFPALLRPQKGKPQNMISGNRWRIIQNIEIETDL